MMIFIICREYFFKNLNGMYRTVNGRERLDAVQTLLEKLEFFETKGTTQLKPCLEKSEHCFLRSSILHLSFDLTSSNDSAT